MEQPQSAMSKVSRSKIRVVAPASASASASNEGPFKNMRTTGNSLQFTLTPTHVSYANTVRRAVLTLVETVAFNSDIQELTGLTSDVSITKNSTPMSNEMLAHRIGLLPIHVSNPLLWKPEEYRFEIKAINDTTTSMDITADNIDVYKIGSPDEEPQKIPSRKFFHPHPVSGSTCLLTVLKGRLSSEKPEELECVMKATVGNGKQNARFIPVSQCSYRYTPDPDEDKKNQVFMNWLTNNKKVSSVDLEADATRKGELQREFATMEAARCYLEQNGEPYSFDFTVETVGVLTPVYILARAISLLQAKCIRYASINVGDLPDTLKVVPADSQLQGFDFIFDQEDHTLGNLFQTWIEQNLMDSGEISFAGYKVPHPLRDQMVLRIGVEKDGQQVTARAAVAQAAKGCADMFGAWRASLEPFLAK